MPRSGRLRTFIKEYRESPRTERVSFFPPFLILALEVILIAHAISIMDTFVLKTIVNEPVARQENTAERMSH